MSSCAPSASMLDDMSAILLQTCMGLFPVNGCFWSVACSLVRSAKAGRKHENDHAIQDFGLAIRRWNRCETCRYSSDQRMRRIAPFPTLRHVPRSIELWKADLRIC